MLKRQPDADERRAIGVARSVARDRNGDRVDPFGIGIELQGDRPERFRAARGAQCEPAARRGLFPKLVGRFGPGRKPPHGRDSRIVSRAARIWAQ